MARREIRRRRSAVNWGVRALIATVMAVTGSVSVVHSLAEVVKVNDPVRAHQLAPNDGAITALAANKLFVDRRRGGPETEAAQLARLAIKQDPTAVAAISTLGLQAEMRGDNMRAQRLFAYSQFLSRRDLQTQLWAIEDAVACGDVSSAVHHYDTALRTSIPAQELLFPVLSKAIVEPFIRESLVSTLKLHPEWGVHFIGYAAGPATGSEAALSLFLALGRARLRVSQDSQSSLINHLIGDGHVNDAWRYYTSVRSGVDRTVSRDPSFSAELTSPTVFDWTLGVDTNVVTGIRHSGTGGMFDFTVPSSAAGTLLSQMQMLPQGTYLLQGHSVGIKQPEQSLPYWNLVCGDGRELGRVIVSNSQEAGGRFVGKFSIPANCTVQTLALIARPSDDITGVTGQIDLARLAPVGLNGGQRKQQ